MRSSHIAVFIFLLIQFSSGNENENQKKSVQTSHKIDSKRHKHSDGVLIFAQVIYRHGDRNIQRVYPNDPYKEEVHWPEGYGQLTSKGKRQQYELGQYFRRRYSKLISDKYSPSEVYIRSTDYDRVIMSAQANLAGLFPPRKDDIWNSFISWQPIPVHAVPTNLDFILFSDTNCPKYEIAFEKYLKESPEVEEIYTKNAQHMNFWSEKCGIHLTKPIDILALYLTLYIEKVHNKSLPDWAQKATEPNGVMEIMAKHGFRVPTGTKQMARLKSGFLIKEIFEHFEQKINSTLQPDRSLWFYSAHDFTIADTLNSLGLFELHLPPYASSLHFELYKTDKNDHYIQIFYRKSNEENPIPLKIPNCGEKCSLDKLHELYSEIIPGDFDSECALA